MNFSKGEGLYLESIKEGAWWAIYRNVNNEKFTIWTGPIGVIVKDESGIELDREDAFMEWKRKLQDKYGYIKRSIIFSKSSLDELIMADKKNHLETEETAKTFIDELKKA